MGHDRRFGRGEAEMLVLDRAKFGRWCSFVQLDAARGAKLERG